LFFLASTNLLPILVTNQAGAEANAYFYLPWLIAANVQLVALNMAMSLTVEASHDESRLLTYARRALAQTARLLAPLVAVIVLGAPYLLRAFGGQYAVEGTTLLRLIGLSLLPNVVVSLSLGLARAQNRLGAIVLVQGAACLLLLGLSQALLPVLGIEGVGWASLVSQTAVAGVLLLTHLRPVIRRPPTTDPAQELRLERREASGAFGHRRPTPQGSLDLNAVRPAEPMAADRQSLPSAVGRRTSAQGPSAELRHHYEVEKELAARLRDAPAAERLQLYKTVYDERLERIPQHPLLVQAKDPAAQARAVAPQLRLLQPFTTPDTVFLELGPGDGALSMAMAGRVKQVIAVDVSDGLARSVAGTHLANLQLCLSDGVNVPAPEASVHLAYSNQVMEHLHPDDGLAQLRNVHKALRPGGAYICVTPNRLSGPWDVSRCFDDTPTGLHLREYSLGELAEVFRVAGFARVKAFVSYHGRRLSPLLPVAPFAWLEWILGKMPRAFGRRLAYGLTAVKVIGLKD
jgi:SAM-dependent methyltransferase